MAWVIINLITAIMVFFLNDGYLRVLVVIGGSLAGIYVGLRRGKLKQQVAESVQREVVKESTFFRDFSEFQTDILKRLSREPKNMLPAVANYFGSDSCVLVRQKNNKAEITLYNSRDNDFIRQKIRLTSQIEQLFSANVNLTASFKELPEAIKNTILDTYSMSEKGKLTLGIGICCSSVLREYRYCLMVVNSHKANKEIYKNDSHITSVIKVCIENCILQEHIVWENEHDSLTRLRNRNKYLKCLTNYNTYSRVGVIFFDVNNLKETNDTLGHEAGDMLIKTVGDSIRQVTCNNVHGYRIGGDEFLIVAYNIPEAQFNELYVRWLNIIKAYNEDSKDIQCLVASGATYADGEIDVEALVSRADKLMYEDKQRSKGLQ